MQGLSRRQAEVLALLDHQPQPSISDIKARLGVRANSAILSHFAGLERKGYIRRTRYRACCIDILRRRDGDRVLIRGQWFRWVPVDQMGA